MPVGSSAWKGGWLCHNGDDSLLIERTMSPYESTQPPNIFDRQQIFVYCECCPVWRPLVGRMKKVDIDLTKRMMKIHVLYVDINIHVSPYPIPDSATESQLPPKSHPPQPKLHEIFSIEDPHLCYV